MDGDLYWDAYALVKSENTADMSRFAMCHIWQAISLFVRLDESLYLNNVAWNMASIQTLGNA